MRLSTILSSVLSESMAYKKVSIIQQTKKYQTHKVCNTHALEAHRLRTALAQLVLAGGLGPGCPRLDLIKARLDHGVGVDHLALRVEIIEEPAFGSRWVV